MRVGIKGFVLGSRGGGIESYIRGVIRGLGSVDPNGDYTLLLQSPLPRYPIPGAEHMRRVVVRSRYGPLHLPFSASLALARERIDVVHVQEAAPLLFPSRMVVTLHDIAYERYPQYFPPAVVSKARRTIPPTLRRARAILTVSEFSKQAIVRRYRVPPDKITVAHGGPDPMFRLLHDPERVQAVRERYSTGGHFILYAGNLEPHKNLKTLITAYVRLRQADTIRHRLVLVGRSLRPDNDIFAAARMSGYGQELVFTGYVPDDDLVALFNAADLFALPSIFEGFGLPPLEAMACGTPVITSNTSSLPETVGDAGLMVEPLDADALADAIATVLRNDNLRAELVVRGLRRVSAFSWDAAARAIIAVYWRAASRS